MEKAVLEGETITGFADMLDLHIQARSEVEEGQEGEEQESEY